MDADELREAKEAVLAVMNNHGERATSLLHSWERSHLLFGAPDAVVRVPHADDNEIDNSLFELCRDQIQTFAGELVGSGQGILLSDAAGRVVETWTSDQFARAHLKTVNTERGADLSEQAVGTNGLGTAIVSGKGIQIRGPEHYADFYTNALCMGEPVFHPESGQVLGAIVLSGADGPHSNLLLPLLRGLVAQMQLRILRTAGDDQLRPDSSRTDLRSPLTVSSEPLESPFRKRLAVAGAGSVASDSGEERVGNDPDRARSSVFGGVSVEGQDVEFTRDEEGRHSLRLLGDATSARALHGDTDSMSIVRDSLWQEQLANVSLTLQNHNAVMIVGESGTGKATLAAMAMRQAATSHPLKEIDAVRAKVDGWPSMLRQVARDLDLGHGLVVRGAECLTERERIELRALFASADEPYMALTTTTDYGDEAGQSIQATVAPTVVLPALRAQPDRIVRLWNSLSGATISSPKLTLRAQKAVSEYHWPGNLRELHHVVATARLNALGADIDIDALPAAIRSTPVGTTMIERAERHALLQALQQAQGNRSQAAAILGVSRATIYRKIKQYRLSQ